MTPGREPGLGAPGPGVPAPCLRERARWSVDEAWTSVIPPRRRTRSPDKPPREVRTGHSTGHLPRARTHVDQTLELPRAMRTEVEPRSLTPRPALPGLRGDALDDGSGEPPALLLEERPALLARLLRLPGQCLGVDARHRVLRLLDPAPSRLAQFVHRVSHLARNHQGHRVGEQLAG